VNSPESPKEILNRKAMGPLPEHEKLNPLEAGPGGTGLSLHPFLFQTKKKTKLQRSKAARTLARTKFTIHRRTGKAGKKKTALIAGTRNLSFVHFEQLDGGGVVGPRSSHALPGLNSPL